MVSILTSFSARQLTGVYDSLAVQKERDRLGKQRSHNPHYGMGNIKVASHLAGDRHDDNDDDDDLSVTALLRAEKTAQEVTESTGAAPTSTHPSWLFSTSVGSFSSTDSLRTPSVSKRHWRQSVYR